MVRYITPSSLVLLLLLTIMLSVNSALAAGGVVLLQSHQIQSTPLGKCGHVNSRWVPGRVTARGFLPLSETIRSTKRALKRASKASKSRLKKRLASLNNQLKKRSKRCRKLPPPKVPPTPTSVFKVKIQRMEDQGEIPKLDRSASLIGPDTNTNGIRDDIDQFIQSQNLPPPVLSATEKMARAIQNQLLVDVSNEGALRETTLQFDRASSCLSNLARTNNTINYYKIFKTIERLTANTRERAARYFQYNKAMSGSVTQLPTGDTCGP